MDYKKFGGLSVLAFIAFVMLAGSAGASTSTTSIHTTLTTISAFRPINTIRNASTKNTTSLPYLITYTLALPYASAGLVLLVVGIAGLGFKKHKDTRTEIAVLTGLVASILLYLLLPSNLLLSLILIFALLMLFAMLEALYRRRAEGGSAREEGGS